MNIVAPSGLLLFSVSVTVSSSTAYYICIPSGFLRISKLSLGSGCGHPLSHRRGNVINIQTFLKCQENLKMGNLITFLKDKLLEKEA